MVIKTNTPALNAHRHLKSVGKRQFRASQRLSSGFRINSAADDAAGLAISEKMQAQIRGLDQARRNAQDAISLIQTAEGGIASINEMLIRMRELVVQAANDTYIYDAAALSHSQRALIQHEIDQLISEIDAVSQRVEFNTMPLLDGSFRGGGGVTSPSGIYPPIGLSADFVQFSAPPPPLRPADVTIIDAATATAGSSGVGWNITAEGVLELTGGGDFQINGAGSGIDRIVVSGAAETNLILNNVDIATATGPALDVRNAHVNLFLDGTNDLNAVNAVDFAGIQTTGGTLHINGEGILNALGGQSGAGIGGGLNNDGGNVTIWGGYINATGGRSVTLWGGGAGIGGGYHGNGGEITIWGGTIVAHAHQDNGNGAGIGGGGGAQALSVYDVLDGPSRGGTIIIHGGDIEARGGRSGGGGAGIGGGRFSSGGNIYIHGGVVRAYGGDRGAGIGSGGAGDVPTQAMRDDGGDITITGGEVFSRGGLQGGASIGGGAGLNSRGAYLTISGGLLQIAPGQFIGAAGDSLLHGTTTFINGNLSILEANIRSGVIDIGGNPLWQVQIPVGDFGAYEFGDTFIHTVTVDGITFSVNAIIDSGGNLFIYLGDPIDAPAPLPPDFAAGRGLWFQIGANEGQGTILHIEALDAYALGLRDAAGNPHINVLHESGEDISPIISILDSALFIATGQRAILGAMQNRLEFTSQSLSITSENLSQSMSRIRDADMAQEMMALTMANILQQAATSMLAQANQLQNEVLQLLQ